MSSRILLQPDRFQLKPHLVGTSQTEADDLFNLRFWFDQGERQWQARFATYVAPELAAEFVAGTVVEAHLETLDHNGPAQRCLPGSPEYAVLGIVLADGTPKSGVPRTLVTARRRRMACSLAMAVVGAVLAATTAAPVLGGLLLGLAVQPMRAALSIPVKPIYSTRVKR